MAKVESGQLELELVRFDLRDLLTSAVNLCREQAVGRSITVDVEIEGPTIITADKRKILQVAVNLVANAVTYTPDGGRVRVCARGGGDSIEVRITDTGPGIASDDQERIFEQFERLESPGAAGTGLGLPLARRFVEAHGGRLTVESQLGGGSTFAFVLPRAGRDLEQVAHITARAVPAPPPPTRSCAATRASRSGS